MIHGQGAVSTVFFKLFLTILACTVGVTAACGLSVCFCSFLFRKLCGKGGGYAAVVITSVIGTPVHEIGHAVMCILFAHRIEAIRLWNPHSDDGRLGFVDHSYNPKNLYACLGNFFIGMGPLVTGSAAVLTLLYFAFPATYGVFCTSALAAANGEIDGFLMVRTCLDAVTVMYDASGLAWYWKIGAIALILSVSLHVSLSPEDVKGSVRAVPALLVLAGTVAGVCTFLGETAIAEVTGFLIRFACITVSLFSAVLLADILLVAVALVIFLFRMLFGRHE